MEPSDDDFIFIRLSPYLDHLIALVKRLNSTEMQIVFMEYDGRMCATNGKKYGLKLNIVR